MPPLHPDGGNMRKKSTLKLRTVYHYGLNNGLGDECKKEDIHVLMSNKFPPLPKKRDRVSRGTIHKSNNSFLFS